jgi:hypothetical protein
MEKYHICYLVCKELCTGINIMASNYIEAVNNFTIIHGKQEIVYITKQGA